MTFNQKIDFITNESDNDDNDDDDNNNNYCRTCPWIGRTNYFKNNLNTLNSKVPSSLPSSSSDSSCGPLSKVHSLDCWDYSIELECLQGTQDLQLAAELGKTLLERNKELENSVKQQQVVIEDQNQKIVYLQKKNDALQEVNEARMKIYSDVEAGIAEQDLHIYKLQSEATNLRSTIKKQQENAELLETKHEEIQKILEETKGLLQSERRKNESLVKEKHQHQLDMKIRSQEKHLSFDSTDNGYEFLPQNCSNSFKKSGGFSSSPSSSMNPNSTCLDDNLHNESLNLSHIENEEILTEFEATKRELELMRQRCTDLEDQLNSINDENQSLRTKVAQNSTNDELRSVSVHDELSILDEVRQGQMCSRCLRSFDDRLLNYDSASHGQTEDDDDCRSFPSYLDIDSESQISQNPISFKMSKRSSLDLENFEETCRSPNIYRELVEKYEALLEVQKSVSPLTTSTLSNTKNEASLEQLNNITEGTSTPGSTIHNITIKQNNIGNSNTASEYSNSGILSLDKSYDENINKNTQTDSYPGSFLCSIGDGDDKFYIYDDAKAIDARFRNRREYKDLFKEIFEVLRKAAENKEDGEKLPLLDDQNPHHQQSKVPPVTPSNEELPYQFGAVGDDTQSITSSISSEKSFAMSECVTKVERKTAKKLIKELNQENKQSIIMENGLILKPLKRQPLEYVQVGVSIKKKNRRKNRTIDSRAEPVTSIPSPPTVFVSHGSGKKRRGEKKLLQMSPLATHSAGAGHQFPAQEWDGNSMIIYNRNTKSKPPSHGEQRKNVDMSNVQYKPSAVSENFQKLKKLDLSYAEVLRRTDSCKHHHKRK